MDESPKVFLEICFWIAIIAGILKGMCNGKPNHFTNLPRSEIYGTKPRRATRIKRMTKKLLDKSQ